jgi:hypothetical protein
MRSSTQLQVRRWHHAVLTVRAHGHVRTPRRATDAQQVEGSPAAGGRSPSVWDVFASKPGNIQDGSTPAVATDFFNKYKEDIALMKAMGVKNFRCVACSALCTAVGQ